MKRTFVLADLSDRVWSKGASRHFSLFEPEDVLQMAILAIGE
ncbi:hypothetical protein EBBID32_42980 [Sphingobium indicum BiD32]|uniref:Uncharacterized protein n=1 Tax=Sphingobium indicum BiD32 TaxID=1301087 RepID=N1MWH8_9SPHN|nr:hypothetical protein EBBID32_42980 [Sphingobium indicum BiD32]